MQLNRGVGGVTRGLACAALGVAAWSTLVEPRLFTVRRHTLPVLPEGAAPLRVLQLSDLHLAPWQHGKIDWVRRLAQLRPDLVVLTGDLLGAGEKEAAIASHITPAVMPFSPRFGSAIAALTYALRPLSEAGVPGVFVHGSNDYYSPSAKNPFVYLRQPSSNGTRQPDLDNAALTSALEGLGFTDLNNSAARLTLRNTGLEVYGLGDPHIEFDDATQMNAAIEALPRWRRKQPPTGIGVVHAPYQRALNELLAHQPELILAGHTHGGQVRMPGVGALTANCDLPVKQARGMSVWYDAHHAAYLNVSAGLGASVYAPIRFACRPEASLLLLEAAR